MSTIIVLSLFVCLLGLVIYFICVGFTKATAAPIAKAMFTVGLLAFLLSGVTLGSCSVSNGPAVHTR